MRAVCWHGTRTMRVEDVPEPKLLNPKDAIIRITASAICGSDLHLYNGYVPSMRKGDIVGHECMGEVVEAGAAVARLKPGDRVVVAATIACGECAYCRQGAFSLCDNSNPNGHLQKEAYGAPTAGIYGYSHLFGGYAGGQAEFMRVPFADVGCLKVPPELPDERVLFLSDILPTGYMAAENCEPEPGDAIAVWGCGPVGQFAIRSLRLLGVERIIAIDRFPERLALARKAGAEPLDFRENDVHEALMEMTGGRGPDACLDAVGMEAHGTHALESAYDRAKQAVKLEMDRPHVLRQMIQACRKGGRLSVIGVYGGMVDKLNMGAFFNKSLRMRGGQVHCQRYMGPLLERVARGEIDPAEIITHTVRLSEAPDAYRMFNERSHGCVKVVLKP